jgi:RNA polymerase sigma-70 factor (ECF subfamily)
MVGWCPQDTEDVVQDTWVRAVEQLAEFRWQSAFRTWLTAIAINRCRELLRRKARKPDEAIQPESIQQNRIEHIDVERAIAALPTGYRMVLVLHDFEGYKHEEIGQLLDINAGPFKSQRYHARRAVRRVLQAPETRQTYSENQA